MFIEVRNQQEFDAAAKRQAVDEIRIMGDGYVEVRTRREITVTARDSSTVRACDFSTVRACDFSTVRACGSSTVRACGSSTVTAYDSSTVRACDSSTVTACGSSTVTARGSSTVTAYGSSTVTACDSSTVTAYDSSTVTACGSSTVTARGSSTVTACGSSTVTARDSSTVRACDFSTVRACDSSTVTAYGSSTVTAYGSSTVTAYGYAIIRVLSRYITLTAAATCVILVHASGAQIDGGQQIQCPAPVTTEAWCQYYGVEIADGCALLYKALNDDYTSPHGMSYAPGLTPVAPDWDGMARECGGGLHFSPTPTHALSFHPDAQRFAGCWVALADIVVHPDGAYPEKIKARAVAKPCFEVNIYGQPVEARS